MRSVLSRRTRLHGDTRHPWCALYVERNGSFFGRAEWQSSVLLRHNDGLTVCISSAKLGFRFTCQRAISIFVGACRERRCALRDNALSRQLDRSPKMGSLRIDDAE